MQHCHELLLFLMKSSSSSSHLCFPTVYAVVVHVLHVFAPGLASFRLPLQATSQARSHHQTPRYFMLSSCSLACALCLAVGMSPLSAADEFLNPPGRQCHETEVRQSSTVSNAGKGN